MSPGSMSDNTNTTNTTTTPSTPSKATKKIIDFTCIERYTECSFCLEQFKEPRILPCSHTYCTLCLIQITNNNLDCTLKCPQCMQMHKIPNNIDSKSNGIFVFPKNLALEQLLDIKPTQLVSSKKCESCNLNYAFTKCLHCHKICCLECKDTHRNDCKLKLKDLFDNLILKSNLIIDKIKADLNDLLFNGNNVKLSLNRLVETIIDEIRSKEKLLYQEIDKIIEEKMGWFNNLRDLISNENNAIKQLLDESSKVINEDSITEEDFIKYENDCKKHLKELNEIEESSFKQKFQIEFNSLFINNPENIKNFITSNIGPIVLNEKRSLTTNVSTTQDAAVSNIANDSISSISIETINEIAQEPLTDELVEIELQKEDTDVDEKQNVKTKLKRHHSNIVPNLSSQNATAATPSFSSLPSTPVTITPPESPSNSARKSKTNLELVKEKGIWAGDENLEYWCPSGVTVNPLNNDIIVSDSWNHRLVIRNYDNNQTLNIISSANGTSSRLEGEFNNPRGIAIDSLLKHLVVVDSGNHRIQIFNLVNYQYKYKFGRYGTHKSEFINPVGVATDSKSQIYVCDRDNHRIQVFNQNGIWLTDWGSRGSLNTQFKYPEYLYVSPMNYLLISDTGNHRIQIFNLDNLDTNSSKYATFLYSFGAFGDAPGYFNVPRGITTDNDGFIMVADSKNNRLQLFEPNGDFVREINDNCSDEFNYKINFDRPVAIYATHIGGLIITEWGRSHRLQMF